MSAIATTCVQVICDDKIADVMKPAFKREVGQFIKSCVMQHASPVLQAMEANMSQDEKNELAKYLQ